MRVLKPKAPGFLVWTVAIWITTLGAECVSAQSFWYGEGELVEPVDPDNIWDQIPQSAAGNTSSLWTENNQENAVFEVSAATGIADTVESPSLSNALWKNTSTVPPQILTGNGEYLPQTSSTPAGSARRMQVALEAVYLSRGSLDGGDFVFDDNGVALNYSELEPGTSTDLRIRWSRVDGYGKGWEFVALKSDSFNARTVVDGPNVVPVFYNAIPAVAQPSWDIDYDSDFETYELNWWGGDRPNLRFGGGFRFINFREEFDIVRTAAPSVGFFSDTDNDLIGFQFLVEYRKWISNQTQLEFGNRTGIFNNNIDVRAFAANGQLHREADAFSFVGNWNAGVRFHTTGLGSWRFGYEAVLLTGVAVAPEQSEALSLFNPSANNIQLGDVFFHGAYGGFEFLF